jgi:hypothetical protein
LNFEAQVGRTSTDSHFAIHKEKEMADFRRWIFALAALSLFAGLASAQVLALTCTATVPSLPLVRSEGFTELMGDIVITCTSPVFSAGDVNVSGSTTTNPNLVGSVTVLLNAPVTSRILGLGTAGTFTEATLLVDDPSGGNAISGAFPVVGCPIGTTGASPASTGSASATCINTVVNTGGILTSTSGNANAFPGLLNPSGTSLTFLGIPVIPPGTTSGDTRQFRITNVRVNANSLAAGTITGPTAITATVLFNSNAQGVLYSASQTVGYAATSLTSGFASSIFATPSTTPTVLLACAAGPAALTSGGGATFGSTTLPGNPLFKILTYTDNFSTAFKARVAPANGTAGNTAATESGYVPGLTGVTASGPNPGATGATIFGGTFAPGLADFGTRVKAVFTGIPTNATIWVPTTNTVSNPNAPVVFTSVTTPQVAPAIVANLITSETGAYSPVTGTQPLYQATSGGVTFVQMPNVGGTSTAVWEVVNPTIGAVATLNFPIAITYNSSSSPVSPVSTGSISVAQSYAPTPLSLAFTAATGGAASGSLNIPRFNDTTAAKGVANINSCRTILMYPYITNAVGFETGIAVANTSSDPFGTVAQAGTCTFNFFGAELPAITFTTPSVTAGETYANTLTAMGASAFSGYSIAICNFQYAHGYAFIASALGQASGTSTSYLALVIPDPQTTTLGRPLTCVTPVGAGTGACTVETATH